jgi:hypothetical protein
MPLVARAALVGFLLAGAAACSRHESGGAAASSVAHSAAPPPSATALKAPSTTAPEIALHNLDGEIADREKKAAKGDFEARVELVPRYLTRAQFEGRVADLKAAMDTSAALLPAHANDARAHLAREKALSAVHEFADATSALDLAAKLGAEKDEIDRARAGILLATGHEDDAAALLPKGDDVAVSDLVFRGALEARIGETAESDRLFELARTRYRDVSPFAVAWMDFERARALELADDRPRARAYLAEAAAVLPCYAHAVVHLAASEPPARALARLGELEKTSDDPDVLAGEADALRRAGKTAEATNATTRAKARFDEVLGEMKLAYADHAAQFFLGMGGDPARALDLAKINAKNRTTDEAVELWLTAAQAATSPDETCAAAKAALALPHATVTLRERATAAAKSCPP